VGQVEWGGVTHSLYFSFVCQLTVSGVLSLYMYDISRGGDVGDGLNAVGDGIIWIRNRGIREPVRLGHTSGRAGVARGSGI